MNNLNNLLIKEFREHQKKRPDEPTESHPSWVHQQYEVWHRENEALRLILGVRLVQDTLIEKTETALPTRDQIADTIYNVLCSQYGSFNYPTDAADAVLRLLKGQGA